MHHAHPCARTDCPHRNDRPKRAPHAQHPAVRGLAPAAYDRRSHARRPCRTRLHVKSAPSLLAEPRASQCPVHSHCASALGLARAGCIHSAGVLQLQHSWTSSARPAASTWGGSAWTLSLRAVKGDLTGANPVDRTRPGPSCMWPATRAGCRSRWCSAQPTIYLLAGSGTHIPQGIPKSGVRARPSREAGGTPT